MHPHSSKQRPSSRSASTWTKLTKATRTLQIRRTHCKGSSRRCTRTTRTSYRSTPRTRSKTKKLRLNLSISFKRTTQASVSSSSTTTPSLGEVQWLLWISGPHWIRTSFSKPWLVEGKRTFRGCCQLTCWIWCVLPKSRSKRSLPT